MTRRAKKILAGVLAAILALLIVYFVWLKSSDTSRYFEYATYVDLKQDQTSTASAVPEFVPPSAKGIWGWYDMDFNVTALEFEFNQADHSSIVRTFHRVGGDQQVQIERKVGSYNWKHQMPQGAGIEAFSRHQEGSEYLVLDRKTWRAYYVSEP